MSEYDIPSDTCGFQKKCISDFCRMALDELTDILSDIPVREQRSMTQQELWTQVRKYLNSYIINPEIHIYSKKKKGLTMKHPLFKDKNFVLSKEEKERILKNYNELFYSFNQILGISKIYYDDLDDHLTIAIRDLENARSCINVYFRSLMDNEEIDYEP